MRARHRVSRRATLRAWLARRELEAATRSENALRAETEHLRQELADAHRENQRLLEDLTAARADEANAHPVTVPPGEVYVPGATWADAGITVATPRVMRLDEAPFARTPEPALVETTLPIRAVPRTDHAPAA